MGFNFFSTLVIENKRRDEVYSSASPFGELEGGGGSEARARWALVGGLNDESKTEMRKR